MKPTILVTSAGGKTGMHVVRGLRAQNYPVRAMVRRVDARAEQLRRLGASVFVSNQYAMADMRRAMEGVQRAYHCAPTAANGLHFGAVFAVAAREAKLEHVVMLSQWLADENHPSLFTREAWLNEQLVDLLPGTNTMINVGWFAENYLMVLEPAAQLGMLTMPLGPGDEKKDAPPSLEDIAAVSVESLINPEQHAGKWYRPTGPELLSPNQVANAIGRAVGRKVTYQNISEAMFLKALKALRPPMYSEALLTQLKIYTEEYRRGAFALGGPTHHVADVLGRPAESFDAIVQRAALSRSEAQRTIGNKFRALRNFAKIVITSKPDPVRIARQLEHFDVPSPMSVVDNPTWKRRRSVLPT